MGIQSYPKIAEKYVEFYPNQMLSYPNFGTLLVPTLKDTFRNSVQKPTLWLYTLPPTLSFHKNGVSHSKVKFQNFKKG